MWREILQKLLFERERNKYTLTGEKAIEGQITLEYWSKKTNLGDALALVIYEWMLKQHFNFEQDSALSKGEITHLMTVGSILNMGNFDATVWGSGILSVGVLKEIYNKAQYRRLDIRAVRGPITRAILEDAGYTVPEIYGDPGILMPFVYKPDHIKETIPYLIIPHYSQIEQFLSRGYKCLDIRTTDYKLFIDQMKKSRLIISSSLHGIILAEAYGIPAVLLNNNDIDLLKYYDYYFSTERKSVKVASSIEEALNIGPMPLPDLSEMQKGLIESFPYDLFDTKL